MDVIVPPIPGVLRRVPGHPAGLPQADHKPTLQWKQRTGLRVPDRADDVELLRDYVRAIYDAGYVIARFSQPSRAIPTSSASWTEELGAVGVPHVLGNPLVAGALKHFGTDEQRADIPAADGPGRPHLDPALQ